MNLIDKINSALSQSKKANEEVENIKSQLLFPYDSYNLPILYLSGNTSGISKDNAVTLNYVYRDKTGTCTLKWQGSSSLSYPKKNYTIKFDNAFEANEGWGEQKKYCLKANYIDFSHSRNVVAAKLWGQIVKSREIQNENLYNLPNGGAIDGFPVMVVINNEYQGLYTFNIPKDGWMFGMGDGDKECIFGAGTHSSATQFKALSAGDDSEFEFEHIPDEDDKQWAVDSLNTLIQAAMDSTGDNYKDTLGQYLDIDSAVDYFIFTCLMCGADATDKNYLLGTFDGVKWFFSAYDLDTTFGNVWHGKSYYNVSANPTFKSYNNLHRVMHLIYTYDKDRLKIRYTELRKTVLSESNVLDVLSNFMVNIPKALKDEEVKLWSGLPGTDTNNLSQIMNFYKLRCKVLDKEIENL